MSPMFSSLRNRNYRIFAAGAVVSNVGTWIQRIAQDWLVLDLTHNNGLALGIVTGLQFGPAVIPALGGRLADRYSRRKIVATTQCVQAVSAAVLGVLQLTGHVRLWHLFVFATLTGLASAVEGPARQAMVAEIVGREDLANAVGLNSASFHGSRMVGPALAGVLIAAYGTGAAFLVNAASFLAVLFALYRLDASALHLTPRAERGSDRTREGFAFLRARPDLLMVIVIIGFMGTFGFNFQLTSALMVRGVYGGGAARYGALASAMAVGSVIGALLAARRRHPDVRLVVVGGVIFGMLEVVAGLMPTYSWYMALLPLIGLSGLTAVTTSVSLLQMATPDRLRGRVMAIHQMVFLGGTPLGSPLVGWVGTHFGARWALSGGGGLSVLGTVGAVLLLSRARRRYHLDLPARAADISGTVVA